MNEKTEKFRENLNKLVKGGLCVAFSGGVDSTVLLQFAKEAADAGGEPLWAVLFSTRLHPPADRVEAEKLAQEIGAPLAIIEVDELSNPEIMQNPIDRCYHCKKLLFSMLKEFAAKSGAAHIADGTNYDDLSQYRPGLKALKELGIASPLAECGLTKLEIRALAEEKGLAVKDKPSSPCLATRLPYNTLITTGALDKIEAGEQLLKDCGFLENRLRVHGDTARIEIPKAQFADFLEQGAIAMKLKALGFHYVTLDLEGFRSGSMDEPYLKENHDADKGSIGGCQGKPDDSGGS